MEIHNSVELQEMTHNDIEVNSWVHNGVEVFCSAKENMEIFSAEITNIQQYWEFSYGYKEVSRVIDNEYFSMVTAPLTLSKVGTDSEKTQTVTTKAYTPTEKALKKYKYAIITAMCAVGSSYGNASLTFGEKNTL